MTTLNNFRVQFSAPLKAEFVALKQQLKSSQSIKRILFNGLNTLKVVDLSQLNHTTCAEDLEFRKALFPELRFWMRDIIVAGKAGDITKQQVIDICTFVRAAAVERVGILRDRYPAQPEVIEVVECDETGRPVIEVQAEIIAELQSSLDEANTALEQAATTIVDATKQIEARNVEIKQLKRENRSLSTKLRTISKATQAYNKAIKVR